jgi:putative tRNA adenosine deaminase-associated protein
VSNFAAAVVRGPSKQWSAAEIDLSGVADIDDVADRLRDVDLDAEVSVLFVESDDTYLVILRLDDGEDLRVFGSDSMFADESRLGALLLGEIEEPALEIDEVAIEAEADEAEADDDDIDEDDDVIALPAAAPDADPVGDADLLADLGVPAHHLLELCSQDGLMPADITADVCQLMGCADEVEELREV